MQERGPLVSCPRAALLALALIAGASWVNVAAAAEWKVAQGPLRTRWAKDVDSARALPEYPRPQMQRDDWMNLNGIWELAEAKVDEALPAGKELPERILVPFPVESELSGVMKRYERVWYRRTFEIPAAWAKGRVLLHFGAVDWEAAVYLNGKLLGEHRGGYDGFSFDITGALRPTGPQELIVRVFDPSDGGDQPRGKQVRNPGGIFYTPATGIWQTAWLEPVPERAIGAIRSTPDVDRGLVRIEVPVDTKDAAGLRVRASVQEPGGASVASGEGPAGGVLEIAIPSAKLWSPDAPFLYDLEVSLLSGDQVLDRVRGYFGMRKVEVALEGKVLRILVNGKFIFQVGLLDQGFWPDGIYTAPTDEALRFDIEATKKLGFNLIRKHVKVEPERWYYWADKLGVLVWQDMPSANNSTPESRKQYERELEALVRGRGNHPSIISWVVFNEGWGQYDTERLTAWVKALDPTRFVNNASGWTDKGVGDVIDMHNYPGPGSPKPEERRAAVLGEFGGLGLKVDGHTWQKETWGYQGMSGREQLTRRYVQLLSRAWGLRDDPGLCAVVYTQTTDVETEANGLLTYDREIVKMDETKVAAANRGQFPRIEVKELVPTSRKQGLEWSFTVQAPGADWMKPGFDDSSWKKGKGGFGTRGTPGSVIGTEWKGPEIWLRRKFTMPSAPAAENLYLHVHHDEDVEIYVNGVLAARREGYTSDYEECEFTPDGRAALKEGENLFAVRCRQTQGGQYVDVGIISLKETPAK